MKQSRFTEEQITSALKQADSGEPVVAVWRTLGISQQTFYQLRRRYQGMGVAELHRLKQLEDENRKLNRLFAALILDKHMPQEVLAKNRAAGAQARSRPLAVCPVIDRRPTIGPAHRDPTGLFLLSESYAGPDRLTHPPLRSGSCPTTLWLSASAYPPPARRLLVNHNRILRLYRLEELPRRLRLRRKRGSDHRVPLPTATQMQYRFAPSHFSL